MTRPEPAWLGPREESGSNDPHARTVLTRDYRPDPAAVDAAIARAAAPSALDYLGDLDRAAEQLRALLDRAYGDGVAFPASPGHRRLWLVLAMDSTGAIQAGLRQLRLDVMTDKEGPHAAATAEAPVHRNEER